MLVVQGEAGSGKSALLEHVATDAKDFRILRCTGVESEAELPFAALHLLLLDCLDRLDSLPAPQAAALRAAFGLEEAPGVDRFFAGLATLTLLSEVAGDGPLLCLVDDAQWVDRASLDALIFAGRRLGAEGVVLLLAMRDGDDVTDLRGLARAASARAQRRRRPQRCSPSGPPISAPEQRDRLIEEAGRKSAWRSSSWRPQRAQAIRVGAAHRRRGAVHERPPGAGRVRSQVGSTADRTRDGAVGRGRGGHR